ncbi:MAG TPA: cupin domain-containing protein [Candidatus Dormibacteraeota bacterium]|nr:cupin domain-containing protein [Candidatus Dormibacteraeota bacterium]
MRTCKFVGLGFTFLFLLLIAAVSAEAQCAIREDIARGSWENPPFPTAPLDVVLVKVTLPPHCVGPWHYHPGPALIVVKQGTFQLTQDEPGCPMAVYQQGQVAAEQNGTEGAPHIHQAQNPGDVETIIYVTFQVPPGEPFQVNTEPVNCAQAAGLNHRPLASQYLPHKTAVRYTAQRSSSGRPTVHRPEPTDAGRLAVTTPKSSSTDLRTNRPRRERDGL